MIYSGYTTQYITALTQVLSGNFFNFSGIRHSTADTRYTSRNSSHGAFTYIWAPFQLGTVTMLLTIPSRYIKRKNLVAIGLSNIGILSAKVLLSFE